ncbi:MAG: long-chain fatty acid--CoA ligase [Desulfobacteraceae bacterium]|nr:long-chain fatty acid--CoA ligase [Desulfobacteraceae bacterium]MBC2750574.1 AMP-binding protein [Desulfobacteraceae bacterium]
MNVGNWVGKRALLYPERPFLKEDGQEWDNQQFDARVNRTAHALAELGVGKETRVAMLMANSSAFLEIFFACAKLGAVIVPLNTSLALPELAHIVEDCAPRLLVYSSDTLAKVAHLKTLLGADVHYLIHGTAASCDDSRLQDVTMDRPSTVPASDEAWDLDTPLLIMYTSGTTGVPKGAVLSHGNFLFGAIHSLHSYHLDDTCKSLVVAPLFHIGALAASVTPVVYAGGALVLKSFDNPSDIITCIMQEKISFMFAVPVMYEMMTKAARWPSADFNAVHFFMAGGAPMPVPLIRRYQQEKKVQFAQGYGMTETLRITALDLADAERKAGSIGKEVFHTRLTILTDDGREAAPGATGELVVKGPTVFQGYWRKPEATAAAMHGGWFHTGDLGRRDADGFLYLVGRKNDLIICAGENIYAAEVERAIEQHPQVAEAAVVGMPDAKRGEVAAAFVRFEDGGVPGEDELLRFLDGKIATFKRPRKIISVETFPRNKAGKILKEELKKTFEGR